MIDQAGHSYAEEMRRRILDPLKLRGTVVPRTSPEIPGLHAHGYYHYQNAGQWQTPGRPPADGEGQAG